MVKIITANDRSVRLLAASAVAASHTGDTDETVLATITVPAGAMGVNGVIRVTALFTLTSSGNNKTVRMRLGGISGTAFLGPIYTTTATTRIEGQVANRGAVNSQIGGSPTTNAIAFGNAAGAVVTGAVDTSQAQTIVISGQLASGADTITLESYTAELLNGA